MERGAVLHPGGLNVLRDDAVRRAVVLDEVAVRGAAREGFDAELAGSGEQVEDVGVADMVLNEIKDVFFDPVGGGTGVHAGDGLEPAAPGGTGNNAHNIFLS